LLRVTDALRRRPALVIVEGESGIGKSRLVREALAVVATAGSQALVVACPPFREALTLGPVVDAVRQAVRLDSLTGSGQGLAEQARAGSENADEPVCRLEASLLDAQLTAAAEGGNERLEERLRDIREEGERRGIIAVWLESAAAHASPAAGRRRRRTGGRLTEDCMRLIADKEMWIWATEIAPVRVAALTALGLRMRAERTVAAFAQGLSGRNAPAAQAALEECRAIGAEARGEAGPAALAWGEAARAWARLPRPRERGAGRGGRRAVCSCGPWRTPAWRPPRIREPVRPASAKWCGWSYRARTVR
jgi:hypothetical protein